MGKFKVGDVVAMKDLDTFSNDKRSVTVKRVDGKDLWFKETGTHLPMYRCILIFRPEAVEAKPTYPNPPHKHREVIIAWANGADIEYKHSAFADWDRAATPIWSGHVAYQVKPSKTPQELKILELEQQSRKLEKQAKELQKTIQELKEV